MNYALFPKEATEEDITEMLFDGEIKCLCYNCSAKLLLPVDIELFECPYCNKKQALPTEDPINFQICLDE